MFPVYFTTTSDFPYTVEAYCKISIVERVKKLQIADSPLVRPARFSDWQYTIMISRMYYCIGCARHYPGLTSWLYERVTLRTIKPVPTVLYCGDCLDSVRAELKQYVLSFALVPYVVGKDLAPCVRSMMCSAVNMRTKVNTGQLFVRYWALCTATYFALVAPWYHIWSTDGVCCCLAFWLLAIHGWYCLVRTKNE